jgi:hypothetical protein
MNPQLSAQELTCSEDNITLYVKKCLLSVKHTVDLPTASNTHVQNLHFLTH